MNALTNTDGTMTSGATTHIEDVTIIHLAVKKIATAEEIVLTWKNAKSPSAVADDLADKRKERRE